MTLEYTQCQNDAGRVSAYKYILFFFFSKAKGIYRESLSEKFGNMNLLKNLDPFDLPVSVGKELSCQQKYGSMAARGNQI